MVASASIPIELMEILNEINKNINEVKERIARIEGQDHSDSLKGVRADINKYREKIQELELEVNNLKTKLLPVWVGLSFLAASAIQFVFRIVA